MVLHLISFEINFTAKGHKNPRCDFLREAELNETVPATVSRDIRRPFIIAA